jgi:hypothetical protein
MVHTWISVRNDRIVGDDTVKSIGARHFRRALMVDGTSFYGDYDLDMYVGTQSDYDSLWAVAAKVIRDGSGWIRYTNMDVAESEFANAEYSSMEKLLREFGWVSAAACEKLLPRKEKGGEHIVRTHVFRRDGNFKLIAVETSRLYYVFCFATS